MQTFFFLLREDDGTIIVTLLVLHNINNVLTIVTGANTKHAHTTELL